MHGAAYDFCTWAVAQYPAPDGLVVELGARNVNGSVRGLFPGRRYLGVDIAPGEGVDVVADGATVVLPDEAAAVVVTTETLEHTPHAAAICANAYRLLQPGGLVLVTCAGDGRGAHSAVDGGPLQPGEYYANVSRAQLGDWLAAFTDVQIVENTWACDLYAVARKPA